MRFLTLLLLVGLLLGSASSPAAAQAPGQDPIDWAREYREIYYKSPEGREDLAKRLGELTFQKYKVHMEATGFVLGGADLGVEFLGGSIPGLSGVSRSVNNLGQFMTLFALLSDTVAGQQGPRNGFLDKRFTEFFKDSTFWAVDAFVKSAAIRGAFWVAQGVDLLLKAFNAYLVQPFFDTYERMWWGAYEHHFLKGPGKRGLDGWLALFGESGRAGYAETMDAFFTSPGAAGEEFVEYWSADGPWKTWFQDADDLIEASKGDPGKLARLVQINRNADRAQNTLRDRFRARFFKKHLYEKLVARSQALLEQEKQKLAAQAREEDARIRQAIEEAARAGRLRVRVEDSSSGTGVAGASVKARFGPRPDKVATASTGSDGTAEVQIPPVTRGTVEVSAPDYRAGSAEFALEAASAPEVFLALDPVIVKAPVTVRVVDASTKRPVAAARVVARLGDASVSEGTGADGSATLSLRQGKTWSLSVSAPHYEASQTTVTPRGGQAVRVALEPKKAALSPGTLRVSAVDAATGRPVEGATVTVDGADLTIPPGGKRVTLPGGVETTLLVQAPGYKARSARGKVGPGEEKSYTARLEAATGQLNVVIQDAVTGKKVARASVQVEGRTVPAPGGSAALTLPAGRPVTLLVAAEGYASRGARGQVAAGQSKDYVCKLEPLKQNGSLTVSAVDAGTGKPLPGAVVKVNGKKMPTSGGVATLTLPANQEVSLQVSAPGYKPRNAKGSVAAGQAKQYTARLEAAGGAPPPPAAATGPVLSGTYSGSITYGKYTIPGFRLTVQGTSVKGGVKHSQRESEGRIQNTGSFSFSGTYDPATGTLQGRLSGGTQWVDLVNKDESGRNYQGSSTYNGSWQGRASGGSAILGSYRMVDEDGDVDTGTFEIRR